MTRQMMCPVVGSLFRVGGRCHRVLDGGAATSLGWWSVRGKESKYDKLQ